MKIKIFYPNPSGKIEFTREELEDLLNDAYNEGVRDGKNSNNYYTLTSPSYISTTATPAYGGTYSDSISATTYASNNDTEYINGGLTVSTIGDPTISCCATTDEKVSINLSEFT